MADNGKLLRNGAEIQIDENGNVIARPAAGQDFIVEDDAVVGSLESESVSTESASITKSGSRMSMSTGQTITDSSTTKIEFDTVEFDKLEVVNITDSEIVVNESGVYLIEVTFRVEDDSAWSDGDQINAIIAKNGSSDHQKQVRKVGTDTQSATNITILDLNQGDTIDGRLFQDSGSDIDLEGDVRRTRLSVGRLG